MTLEQEVKNRNEYHQICIKHIDAVLPYVKSMVGQRISIASGWSKKWNPPVNVNVEGSQWVSRYFEASYGCFYVGIKTSFNNPADVNGNSSCEYYEARFELGKIDDQGKLISVNEVEKIHVYYENLNDVIDYATEKAKFDRLKEIEKERDEIVSSIKVDRHHHYYGLGSAYKR